MLFSEAGTTYDTDRMGRYALADCGAVYIDHEHRLVFVQLPDSAAQGVIHRLTRDELENCASRYALPELLAYLTWFEG